MPRRDVRRHVTGRTNAITHPRTTSSPRTPSRTPAGSGRGASASGRGRPAHRGSFSGGNTGSRTNRSQNRPPSVAAQVAPPEPRRSPRPAISTWAEAGLPATLITTLERRDMHAPFAIQSAALPDAMAGEHLLARAKTGAGKTLGFGLPMIARLAAGNKTPAPRKPRGLILVPTRELATQVADALAPLAQPLGLRLRVVVGGASMGRQIEQLKQRADIVVATPGRLTDLIERNACELGDVEITVLDEADHMCDLGFFPVVTRLLAQVPADGQRMMFSATLDGDVDKLAKQFLPDPVLVAIDPEVSAVDTMEHRPLEVTDTTAKLNVVTELAGGQLRTLVFVRTKHGADRLARQLSQAGVPARPLHGGLMQNARTRALAAFTDGSARVLVATDVMARGIHVDGVDLVVHADPPTEPKAYLHRSGRTARAGADGTVIVIALPDERRAVERLLINAGVKTRLTRVSPGDVLITEIVGEPADRVYGVPVDTKPPVRQGAPRSSGPRQFASSGAPRTDVRRGGAPTRSPRSSDRPSGDRPYGERAGSDRPSYSDRPPRTASANSRPSRRPQGTWSA